LLLVYSFVYNIPDDGIVEAETCSSDVVNKKLLFVTNCAVCWINYCVVFLSIYNRAMYKILKVDQSKFDKNTAFYSCLRHVFRVNIFLYYKPGSSVGIATDYGLDGPGSNPGEDEIFRKSKTALEPTQPPVQWVPCLSWG